jgi:hypothetical protein
MPALPARFCGIGSNGRHALNGTVVNRETATMDGCPTIFEIWSHRWFG